MIVNFSHASCTPLEYATAHMPYLFLFYIAYKRLLFTFLRISVCIHLLALDHTYVECLTCLHIEDPTCIHQVFQGDFAF